MTKQVFIDTQLWIYSKKKPILENFSDQTRFNNALKGHTEAIKFFGDIRKKRCQIYLSSHQISELYHALSFRGFKIPRNESFQFIQNLKNNNKITIVEINWQNIINALERSARSAIHIWDYLCILPLVNKIDICYTNDKHYQDQTFQGFKFRIENPLTRWEIL